MGIIKDITELSERLGAGTADFSDKLAEGVREFSCSLWEQFPDKFTQGDQLSGSFTRGFMNNMCKDKTLPPPPIPPFNGGQCETNYNVTVHNYSSNLGNCIPYDFSNTVNNIPGQISGLRFEPIDTATAGQGGANTNAVLNEVYIVHSGGTAETFINNNWVTECPNNDRTIIENIVRSDGQPDNCGNPNSTYPTTSPNPNVDYVTNIVINSEDGDTLNFPLTYTPINISFPIHFDLGGLTVVIDLGGINFYFSLLSIDGVPLPLPDGNWSPLPAPGDDKNREIPIPKLPPPSSPIYDPIVRDPDDPKEEEIGLELEFVRITLTSKPVNHKRQFGDGAPNVIYAGWFEFQSEGYNFPRQPIHFDNCLYRKPEGATGYAYTLYQGFIGFATVYIKKEELV